MKRLLFLLGFVAAIATLAPFAFAGDIQFDATADATFTSFRGAHASGIIENGSSAFGAFTGTFERKITRKRTDVQGTVHLVFANGDTLEISFHVLREPDSTFFSGTFTLTGGTGQFDGATGEGAVFYDVANSPIPFTLIGNP